MRSTLLAIVVVWATPRVPVLLVFWKKAAAPTLLRIPELERYAFVPPVRSTLLAIVVVWATPSVPVLLVFWKKAAAPTLERIPELERMAVAPPVKKTLDALLKVPALLRYPVAAVIVRLDASVAACATPSVPVLLVFWKKAAAPTFDRIPELLRKDVAPPVRRTLEALLKMPALLMKAPGAV